MSPAVVLRVIPVAQVVPLSPLAPGSWMFLLEQWGVLSAESGCSPQSGCCFALPLLCAGVCEVDLDLSEPRLLEALLGWRGVVLWESTAPELLWETGKAMKVQLHGRMLCSEKQREERTVIFCDSRINRASVETNESFISPGYC